MPQILKNARLLRVSKSEAQTIKNWQEGVSLENDAGLEIAQIMLVVAGDRWRLG